MKEIRSISPPSWLCASETQKLLSVLGSSAEVLRFVGGCVRDTLQGKQEITDLDVATSLKPKKVLSVLQNAGIKTIPLGLEHGTVLAVLGPYRYEITTLRRDIKTDGRHADVSFTQNWDEDAQRRDFTFNALYLAPSALLYDPWEGEKDLIQGVVRFIGDPETRIQEDYLRILRYFRFYAFYGKEPFFTDTLKACRKHASCLQKLSAERRKTEIFKLLNAPIPLEAIQQMIETDIWAYALEGILPPDLKTLRKVIALEKEFQIPPKSLRRLAALLRASSDESDKIAQSLKFSCQEKNELGLLLTLTAAGCHKTEEMLYTYGLDVTRDVLILQGARGYNRLLLDTLPSSWIRPTFPLSGSDLHALGVAQGPLLGNILRRVEKWWIQHHFKPDYEACLHEAQKFIRN